MSTFVKLASDTRFHNCLGILDSDLSRYKRTRSNMGISVLTPKAVYQNDGNLLEEDVIKSGSKAKILVDHVNPNRYHVMVEANPALYEFADVQYPRILEPGDELALILYIKAHKNLDLTSLEYFVRMYVID